MDNRQHIDKYIQKILKSQEFKDSENIKRLFIYLYECFLKNTTPKESQIAINVFSRESSFNSADDPIVRVSAHNLRKKLTNYYNTDGKNDKIKAAIPIGHYQMEFVDEKKSFFKLYIPNLILVLFFFIFGFMTIITILLFRENQKLKNPPVAEIINSPIWKDFFNINRSNLIVLGDFLIIREMRNKLQSEAFVRIPKINESEEFEKYQRQYSDILGPMEIFTRHTYLAEYCAWPLLNLIPLFCFQQKPLDLKLVSTLTADDLNKNNIIFIGYYKTLGLLKKYFSLSTLSLINYQSLLNKSANSDSTNLLRFSGPIEGYNRDYGLLAKFVGPKDNDIILCCAFRYTGTLSIIENITKKEPLNKIEEHLVQQFGKIPENFEILFEINGYGRKSISSKIIICNKLESPERIWNQ